jgi:hypothetical protein
MPRAWRVDLQLWQKLSGSVESTARPWSTILIVAHTSAAAHRSEAGLVKQHHLRRVEQRQVRVGVRLAPGQRLHRRRGRLGDPPRAERTRLVALRDVRAPRCVVPLAAAAQHRSDAACTRWARLRLCQQRVHLGGRASKDGRSAALRVLWARDLALRLLQAPLHGAPCFIMAAASAGGTRTWTAQVDMANTDEPYQPTSVLFSMHAWQIKPPPLIF